MNRWFQKVFQKPYATLVVVGWAVCVVVFYFIDQPVETQIRGQRIIIAETSPGHDNILWFQGLCLGLGALIYGGVRASCFNPLFQKEYSKWLQATCATGNEPLPMGPLQLVWQDAVVLVAIGATAALTRPNGHAWITFPALVIVAYLLAHCRTLNHAG